MDLMTALDLHRRGRLADAEMAYRALLLASSEDHGALHGLGVLRYQAGDCLEAVTFLRKAVTLAPPAAEYWFNLGLALERLGEHADAAAAFGEAIRRRPAWPEPHYDRGRSLHAAGRLDEAARAYRAALKLRSEFFQAEVNLANVLRDAGKYDQAIAAYRRVLRRRPELADVHFALATILLSQKDNVAAESALRCAIGARADYPAACEALARLFLGERRFAEALPLAARAFSLLPGRADFAETLGRVQCGVGQHGAALSSYRTALLLEPSRHSARFGMAEALRAARNFTEAEAVLREMVATLPQTWLAHHEHGNVLRDLGRFKEAEAAYRTALAIAETPLALNNLAAVLRDLGRLDEALATAERGLALAPTDLDIQYNLAVAHLTAGRLREGFSFYEVRTAKYNAAPPPGRAWDGRSSVHNRTILVAAEQGLGDTIQFVRYLPALAQKGARIVLLVPATLLALVAQAPGVYLALDRTAPLPPYDFHVPLMSLPHMLRLYEPCPIPVPYLSAGASSVCNWQARLAEVPGLKVGLVWAGNPGFAVDHLRSIAATALSPLGNVAGVSLVSLQKGAPDQPSLHMIDWTDELTDMEQTAALVASLDLIISVDTAVAHLAGALGKPVWLLNRSDTCWRWGSAGDGCIWYPSLRQFRQDIPGDWEGPLQRVAAALTKVAIST